MKKLRIAVVFAAATALIGSIAGCAPTAEPAAEPITGGTLTLATAVDNDTFDPAKLTAGAKDNYWQAVYDTVLKLDYESVSPQANLATEWSYNEDFTELTIELRDDVTFWDGSPLDAEAVRVNALALRDGGGTNALMMASLEDVEVVDDFTAIYHLTKPDPAFLGYLTTVGGAVANPLNVGTEEIATEPAGSGPYILDTAQTVAGTEYVFTRNEDYWNIEGFPYDEIHILPIVEAAARVNALKSGQINAAVYDPSARPELEASGLTVDSNPVDWRGLMLVDRNGVKTPALADVRVRQAINYALDREAFLENVELGEGVPTTQIFIPGDYGYVDELDDMYQFDPDKARELLADAGYPDGFDLVIPAFDFRSAVQPLMIQQLADVGIRVTTEQVVPDQYNTTVRSGAYSAFWIQLTSGDAWRNVSKNLPPTASWNAFKTEDPELTELITEAQEAYGDEDAYREAMGEISRYTTEQAYFAAWYRINSQFATDGTVDFTFTPWATTPELRTYRHAAE